MCLGSWNVRTLLDRHGSGRPERRTALIAKELARYNIGIAALSETRLPDHGKLSEVGEGYTFYWTGHPENERREHGVGFAVADQVKNSMVGEPVGVNPRIMKMRIQVGRKRIATILSVYGPTMCNSDIEKEAFFTALSAVVSSVPAKDRLFLLGDLNARVGRDSRTWRNIIGPHGIGSVNDNGERLLSLCASQALSITNTWFNVGENAIATWNHPRSGHGHLLDYVIVRQRDLPEVRVTRVMRGAECNTDHKLVRTKVCLRLGKAPRSGASANNCKFDLKRFQVSSVTSSFQKNVAQSLGENDNAETPDKIWQRIKKVLIETAAGTLGHQSRKRPDWFDENNTVITALVKEKNAAYLAHIDDPANPLRRSQLTTSRRNLARTIRQLKEDWWVEKSKDIQRLADARQTKAFYDSLKAVFGPSVQCIQTLIDSDTGEKLS
ncbi:MAG: endonuclease/exonuclease/phosphatase family protein, partial [Aeromonas sp.]